MIRTGVILALAVLGATEAHAGGYAVAEQGTAAAGTGGAATARTDDAAAAWYNPALLAMTSADAGALRLGLGLLSAHPAIRAEAVDGSWSEQTARSAEVPHLHASYRLGPVAAGVAVGVPFGGGVAWPAMWPGRSEIISSQLMVVRTAPFVAYAHGRIAVAAGVHVDAARLQIARSLDFVDTEGEVALDLDGVGVGGHVALAVQASPALVVGATYKSGGRIALDGGADFEAPVEFTAKTADQNVRAELAIPDRVALGAAYRIGAGRVLADLEWVRWSVNEALEIDFERDATPDVTQMNRWSSTLAVRAGYEHVVAQVATLRAGGFYDPSPAPDSHLAPSSPDATRAGLTAGAGYRLGGGISADLFYEYMRLFDREASGGESLAARYDGNVHMLGLGLQLAR